MRVGRDRPSPHRGDKLTVMAEGPRSTGEGGSDPFDALLDPDFAESASVIEPSAEHRLRAARRAARAADLQARLVAESREQEARALRDRKAQRKSERKSRVTRFAAPAVFLVVLAVLAWAVRSGSLPGGPGGGQEPADPEAPSPDGEATERLAPLPDPPPQGGAHEFTMTNDDGSPVAFDPCRTVHWALNPAGAPPGSEALVKEAVARMAAATGLVFEYDGSTDEGWAKDREPFQEDRYGNRWAPVLVAWATQSEQPGLAGYIAGLGGGQPYGFDGELTYVSGSLLLDGEDIGRIPLDDPQGAAVARGIIMHELGHVVGLDHVADPNELMYSETAADPLVDWGPGDLTGLRVLGDGACHPEL